MVKQGNKSRSEYMETKMESYSTIKMFEEDRKKYYRKYILGEEIEEEDTFHSKIGNIVEIMILEPDKVDEKLYYSEIDMEPTGKMAKFVDSLFRLTQIEQVPFEEAVHRAYYDSDFQWKIDTVLNKFYGSINESYFKEKVEVFRSGKILVSVNEHQIADAIKNKALENKILNDIVYFSTHKSDKIEVLIQEQIYDFFIDGVQMKSMIDIIVIDHENRKIQIYDLKCTWATENFYHSYYLKRKSYLQAYIYHKSVEQFAIRRGLDYRVEYPSFILVDSGNFTKTITATLDHEDIENAYYGFEEGGRRYRGLKEILEDLKWCHENNIWDTTKSICESDFVVKLRNL